MNSNSSVLLPFLAAEDNRLVVHWQDVDGDALSIPVVKADDPRLLGHPTFWKVGFVGIRADYNTHFPLYRVDDDDVVSENEFIVVLTTQHQLHRCEGGRDDEQLVLEPIRLEFVVKLSSAPKEYFNPSEFNTDPWWAFPRKRKPTRSEVWWNRLRRFI